MYGIVFIFIDERPGTTVRDGRHRRSRKIKLKDPGFAEYDAQHLLTACHWTKGRHGTRLGIF